jgi:4-amino-4-deoxy-L-arabinose transferase-like glycosyltransferase
MITDLAPPAGRAAVSGVGALAPDGAARLSEQVRCARLFWGWLVARTVLWTGLAFLTQPNAPLDLIEWLAWGHEWRWGYPKHPPLPAWIAEIFAHLSPGDVWGVYLGAYLVSAVCLWAAWRLACELLPPRVALLAALSLEGLVFFNYDASEFSNNVVLNACWAAAVLCLYQALHTDRPRWWLGLGAAVGLGLLSKYTLGFLLAPMALYLVIDRRARRCLRRPGPYLAALTALGLFLPHALWMVRTDFLTVRYALDRASDAPTWGNHLRNPVVFALSQAGRLLPVLFVLAPLTTWRWRLRRLTSAERRARTYLLAVVLGPVGLLVLVSLLTGCQVREIWGSPLWTFAGLLALVAVRTETAPAALARARWHLGMVVVFFVGFAVVKNCAEPAFNGRPGRIHFPGKELAQEVTRRWGESRDRPFGVVGGEAWLAGNVACYAPQRPSLYSSGDVGYLVMDQRSPWTDDADLCRRGGVLVWDADQYGADLPDAFQKRFPTAQVQPPLTLAYRCAAAVPPVRVGMAFVLPPRVAAGALP